MILYQTGSSKFKRHTLKQQAYRIWTQIYEKFLVVHEGHSAFTIPESVLCWLFLYKWNSMNGNLPFACSISILNFTSWNIGLPLIRS